MAHVRRHCEKTSIPHTLSTHCATTRQVPSLGMSRPRAVGMPLAMADVDMSSAMADVEGGLGRDIADDVVKMLQPFWYKDIEPMLSNHSTLQLLLPDRWH